MDKSSKKPAVGSKPKTSEQLNKPAVKSPATSRMADTETQKSSPQKKK